MPALAAANVVQTLTTGSLSDVTLSASGATAYVSNTDGWVTAFDVASGDLRGRWKVGTTLAGMDVSPDGRYLIAAEATIERGTEGVSTIRVHRLDLQTGQVTDYTSKVNNSYQSGFYDVAWAKDGSVLVTRSSGPEVTVWSLDTATGQFWTVSGVPSQYFYGSFTASQDRSKILFGIEGSGSAPLYVYDGPNKSMTQITVTASSSNNGLQAISNTGMVAQAIYGQLLVYDSSYKLIGDLVATRPDLKYNVAGAEFSADGSKLFVLDTNYDRILQFSTTDWSIERSIQIGSEVGYGYYGSGAYGDRLSLSADSAYLVVFSGTTVFSVDTRLTWDPGTDKADVTTGDAGANTLFGFGGNDVISGGAGNDNLYGDSGNDTLIGGPGNDVLNGGEGIDTVDYSSATSGITVNLFSSGGWAYGANENDTLYSIENIKGSAFNDTLTGGDEANVLEGGAGDDILGGGRGSDTLLGGAGDDRITGGLGDDIIDGGAGNDMASYADALLGVRVDLSKGAVIQNTLGGGADTLIGIENLTGSSFNDVLMGSSDANTFEGGQGDDIIDGGAGVDTAIYGSASTFYTWTRNADGSWTVADKRSYGDGLDTLLNVETLKFTDKSVTLSSSDTTTTVQALTPRGAAQVAAGGSFLDVVISSDSKSFFTADGDGYVVGYSIATGGVIGRWKVGALLAGMDVSADGRYLFVAEKLPYSYNESVGGVATVHRLDLQTGQVKDFTLAIKGSDRGFYDVAVAQNGLVYLSQSSSAYQASLWTLDTSTGTFAPTQNTYYPEAALTASSDRTKIMIGPQGIYSGSTYLYDTATKTVTGSTDSTYSNSGVQAVSATAKLMIQATYGQVIVYDLTGKRVIDLGTVHPTLPSRLGGTSFSVDGKSLFAYDISFNRVLELSTADWSIKRAVALGYTDFITGSLYGDRLVASADGHYLTVTTNLGVSTIDLQGDWRSGSDGADTLNGDAGPNILYGFGGNDVIDGGAGDDKLYGDAGDDRLIGGEGSDLLDGGAGNDTADYSKSTAGVVVSLMNASYQQDTRGAGFDILVSIENLVGSAFFDQLWGDANANRLEGGDGDDILYGNEGGDTLIGGAGDDLLFGQAGDDTYDGGAGFDIVSYETAALGVAVDLSKTGLQNTRGGGVEMLTSIEGLKGSPYSDILTGDAGANMLDGGAGDDILTGGAGDDLLTGGAGNDTIDGGAGNDTVRYAGAQADYAVVNNADGSVTVTDIRTGSPDGVDKLIGIETISFSSAPSVNEIANRMFNILRIPTNVTSFWSSTKDLMTRWTSNAITGDQVTKLIVDMADSTTSVASMSYQFFTGKVPTKVGVDFLISPTGPNTTNLNSAYYAQFDTVNRYINFAVNLGKNGEAKDSFTAAYGSLSLFDATKKAYAAIFGGAPTDAKVHALIDTRIDYLAYYGGDGATGIGTKAAMVGFLLAAAATENLGVIAKSNDAWLADLADGLAPFAVNILDPANGYYKADFVFGG